MSALSTLCNYGKTRVVVLQYTLLNMGDACKITLHGKYITMEAVYYSCVRVSLLCTCHYCSRAQEFSTPAELQIRTGLSYLFTFYDTNVT